MGFDVRYAVGMLGGSYFWKGASQKGGSDEPPEPPPSLKSQVVLLQTAHSWANAGVVLGARMHRERGSFRSN